MVRWKVSQLYQNYAMWMIESIREQLGYDIDDMTHDDEVYDYLTGGEKISKSKHMK